jgi:hypothetical protein
MAHFHPPRRGPEITSLARTFLQQRGAFEFNGRRITVPAHNATEACIATMEA